MKKEKMIEGVVVTPLRMIIGEFSVVLHAMKQTEPTFCGFGEAYFSSVKKNVINAWKRHREATQNLVVPCGEIKFVLYDDRINSPTYGEFYEIILSRQNYQRLTIPSMVWYGFKGLEKGLNMLMNVSDIPHDSNEADREDISFIPYNWEK